MSTHSNTNSSNTPMKSAIAAGTFLLLGLVVWQGFEWTVCRIYVPVNKSLLLQYKGIPGWTTATGPTSGRLARRGEKGELQLGVQEEMPGPGRHFYCPLWWERKLVDDVLVKPGEIAVVTSLVGEVRKSEEGGNFLVEGELGQTRHAGPLRRVYGPGRYRINPYAYSVEIKKTIVDDRDHQAKHSGWVNVPAGLVGVVTNKISDPDRGTKRGIQDRVLQPGIYLINPREQEVDVVLVGFLEKSIVTHSKQDAKGQVLYDESGEPIVSNDGSGINFPSKDGFNIYMDFTAIWGISPEQAPDIVRYNGNLKAVEDRIILPLIESVCRNEGSKLGAVDLLIGDSREAFQEATAVEFREKLGKTGISLQYGLIRYIYIPREVRLPIQQAFIADELKLTRDQDQLTAKTEAMLREEERKVDLETETTKVETEKLVAKKKAEGAKRAAETAGETKKLVAEVDRKVAELESQSIVMLGKAESESQRLLEESKSERFSLAVKAFGSGQAFNQWVFANGLPEDIKLNLLYAGPGTFWTDLKGFTDVMLSRQLQQGTAPTSTGTTTPTNRPTPPRK